MSSILMTKVIQKGDSSSVFSLEMAKLHARVDDALDDPLMELYLSSAIDFAEQYMNRFLAPTNILATFDVLDAKREVNGDIKVFLPYAPTAINSVTAYDSEGTAYDISFRFNAVAEDVVFSLVGYDVVSVDIDYTAGYEVTDVPKAIVMGIYMLTATLFNVREDISYGISVNELPFKSKNMFDKYKIYTM